MTNSAKTKRSAPDDTGELQGKPTFEEQRFKPGTSGNPAGRPRGARSKLGEEFLDALYADWQEHGPATIERVRTEKPDQYLKVVASLVPRDINLRVNPYEDMTDDELIDRMQELDEVLRPLLVAKVKPH